MLLLRRVSGRHRIWTLDFREIVQLHETLSSSCWQQIRRCVSLRRMLLLLPSSFHRAKASFQSLLLTSTVTGSCCAIAVATVMNRYTSINSSVAWVTNGRVTLYQPVHKVSITYTPPAQERHVLSTCFAGMEI